MANEPKTTSAKAEDIQKVLEQQISELRDEIARINDAVAERSADMMDSAREKASEVYEGAADRAARATRQLRSQANVVRLLWHVDGASNLRGVLRDVLGVDPAPTRFVGAERW